MSVLREFARIYALVFSSILVLTGVFLIIHPLFGRGLPHLSYLAALPLGITLMLMGLLIIYALVHRRYFFVYHLQSNYAGYAQQSYHYPFTAGYPPHYASTAPTYVYVPEVHSTDERLPQNVLKLPSTMMLLLIFLLSIIMGFASLFLGGALLILFPLAFIVAFSFPSLLWISYVYSKDISPEPRRLVLIALTWGMLSVNLAFIAETLFSIMTSMQIVLIAIIAPIAEETFKPLAIPYLRRYIADEMDGLIYGVTCGMGFAMIENMGFEINFLIDGGGHAPGVIWAMGSLLRGLFSTLGHAVFTGMIGFAIVRYWQKSRHMIIAAFASAILLHASWNATSYLLTQNVLLIAFLVLLILVEFSILRYLLSQARRSQIASHWPGPHMVPYFNSISRYWQYRE